MRTLSSKWLIRCTPYGLRFIFLFLLFILVWFCPRGREIWDWKMLTNVEKKGPNGKVRVFFLLKVMLASKENLKLIN